MRETPVCTAADAIYKLAAGNLKYLNAENGSGDISRRIRMSTWAKGQSPYAIIVTCSDSRVIPENIFSAGIGELFVIRLAGNIIDDHQLGSIEYAARPSTCRPWGWIRLRRLTPRSSSVLWQRCAIWKRTPP